MNADRINEQYYGDITEATTERARQRVHWMCRQVTGRDVLDIGCSQGIVCLILGREGFRCTGIDLEERSLDVAREALSREDEVVRRRVTFQGGDASELPFKDGSFDTVMMGEILEHLTHPERVLAEARRVLREGGRLVVTVPHGLNAFHDHKRSYYPVGLLELLRPFLGMRSMETSNHYILYTGVKGVAREDDSQAKEPVVEDYRHWEQELEARCMEKERALFEAGIRHQAQVKSLTTQGAVQAAALRDLNEAMAARETRLNEVEAELEASRVLLGTVRRDLAQAKEEREVEVRELTARAGAAAERVRELEGMVELGERQLRELERRFTEVVAAAHAAEEERLAASALQGSRIEALGTEAADLANRVRELMAGVVERDERIAELGQQLDQAQGAMMAVREQLQRAEAAQVRLGTDVGTASAALEAMEQQNAVLRSENEELRQELGAREEAWQGRIEALEQAARAGVEAKDRQLDDVEARHVARLRAREKQLMAAAAEREARWERERAQRRLREFARSVLPEGVQVLVVSKGDDDLLRLEGRYGRHFPQGPGGVYAGYHPENSRDAIAHLEALRAQGAGYLLIPASSWWWLEFYADFRRHLESQFRCWAYEEGVCVIYQLEPVSADRGWVLELTKREGAAGKEEVKGAAKAGPKGAVSVPRKTGEGRQPERKGPVWGVILDEFTTGCLEPECRLTRFRPDNWRVRLENERPEAVFVESAWRGNDGAWQYRVASYERDMGNELADLLSWAREEGIPTIFWNKEDPVHFERFIERARGFAHVFTTDAHCIPRYRERVGHERVYALPFAAQPAIHHPVLEAGRSGAVCFAGTFYGDRHEQRQVDMEMILRPAIDFGLEIFDRQHGLTGKGAEAYRFPEVYQPCIRGRLDYDEMVKAYKRYRVFLNVNSVKQSPTMFSRRVFELLACGTPVVSTYARGIVELLGEDVVFITESEGDTRRHLERLLGDEEEWMQASVRGIRKVLREHTYGHRLREICERVGLKVPEVREPRVAVVARVAGEAELAALAEVLAAQTYRRFELILVSGVALASRSLEGLGNALRGVRVHRVVGEPGDVHGACMAASAAEHLAFLDARDTYGANHLLDLALAATYAGVDFVGRHTFYEGDAAGGRRLRQRGYEFRRVSSVPSATLLARKAALTKPLLMRALTGRVFQAGGPPILSIDRFNYLQNSAAGGARGEGVAASAVMTDGGRG
jgi:spore maturation protein CgeB/SAM-dependent methyltransferase